MKKTDQEVILFSRGNKVSDHSYILSIKKILNFFPRVILRSCQSYCPRWQQSTPSYPRSVRSSFDKCFHRGVSTMLLGLDSTDRSHVQKRNDSAAVSRRLCSTPAKLHLSTFVLRWSRDTTSSCYKSLGLQT